MEKLLEGMEFDADIAKAEILEAASVLGLELNEEDIEFLVQKAQENW